MELLSTLQDIQCFLVGFVADALRVCPRRGDQEIERLQTCVAGTLGHHVKELPIRLRMELVKHNPVHIEAVLGVGFR